MLTGWTTSEFMYLVHGRTNCMTIFSAEKRLKIHSGPAKYEDFYLKVIVYLIKYNLKIRIQTLRKALKTRRHGIYMTCAFFRESACLAEVCHPYSAPSFVITPHQLRWANSLCRAWWTFKGQTVAVSFPCPLSHLPNKRLIIEEARS